MLLYKCLDRVRALELALSMIAEGKNPDGYAIDAQAVARSALQNKGGE